MSQARTRRRRKVEHTSSAAAQTITAALLLALLVASGTWLLARLHRGATLSRSAVTSQNQAKLSSHGQTDALRRVYPLSIIPGGAYSAKELAVARALDPVVASHYSDFGSAAVIGSADRDLFMFVSYRKSDRVYWTKTRHRIPKGEMLIKAGGNLARARCGNRLSAVPLKPVISGAEPTEEVLNTPQFPKAPWEPGIEPPMTDANFYVPSLPISSDSAAIPAFPEPAKNVVTGASPGNNFVAPLNTNPLGSPIFAGAPYVPSSANTVGGNNSGTGNPGQPTSVVIIPGVATPEPATVQIFSIGLVLGLVVLFLRQVSRKKTD